jgi:hypothetical protein
MHDAKVSSKVCRNEPLTFREKEFNSKRREECFVVTETKEGGTEG